MERNEETVPLPPSPRESSSSLRARSGPDLLLVIYGSDVFNGIFRCYAVIVALIVVFAETEWEFMTKFWKVLEYWVGRGMLQIFVAVMTRAFPDYSSKQKQFVVLENVASYMLLACGVVYVVLGILCIGCLKRSHQQKTNYEGAGHQGSGGIRAEEGGTSAITCSTTGFDAIYVSVVFQITKHQMEIRRC
ncbi:hypothetical protein OIU76_025176 [Salix suchowensis]|nr:hypothetical protein OIU76_025176 [Salix suchowensis]